MARDFKVHVARPGRPAEAAPGRSATVTPARAEPARFAARPKEIGGPSGPEPTRYGDWERKGICYDF